VKLIVGLGNPGKVYARNRHNVGFRCLNHYARRHSIRFDRKQCRARVGTGEVGGERVLLARPMTFVNLSGTTVACLVRKHDIPLSDLLIVYDDLDLPIGKIRLRQSGGSAGHRGMNSLISALGSEDFPRVRVGIEHPQMERQSVGEDAVGEDAVVSHVLGGFSSQEEKLIEPAVATVSEVIDCFLTNGIEAAMNKFN